MARVTKHLGAVGPPGRDGPGLAKFRSLLLEKSSWLNMIRAGNVADIAFHINLWHFYCESHTPFT